MGRRRLLVVAAALASLLAAACGGSGPTAGGDGGTLRVSGSTTVNPVAADAAEVLRKQGLTITVDAQGGSAGGISQLAQGQVEIAMSSKPIGDEDRAAFPSAEFVTTQIGSDAVGIIVRREVYDGGVRNLTRDQLKALFEGRVRNWRELGGPDVEVFVYDKEPGRGTREVIDKYLYDSAKAPPPPQSNNFAVVGGNEEGRAKVLSTPGGVTPLSTSFVNGYPKLAAVAVDGVEPTPAHVVDQSYAMFRPLYLVTDGPPTGPAKTFVDYVVGDEGQRLVAKHGYLTLAELGTRR
ncbi:MAG TPA: phosphate ABC transporter substrate-binding protein [Acidimicrobiales bacterium]|nr:phosphate ABC transporter substrate-binding protein [Acidimicrobiales bacterium]